MNVIVFGGSGMVGQGILRECLLDPTVDRILAIGRTGLTTIADQGPPTPGGKLRELILPDVADLSSVEPELTGYDACLYSLGVSAGGMREPEYRRLTFDLTLAVAATLSRLNPQMVFAYVSGAGTDSSEHGRSMWARVKGATENALLRLPFRAAYMFRPGIIEPLHGIRSRTPAYRLLYTLLSPVLPIVRSLFPNRITTTERLGRAMLRVARVGYVHPILEIADIAKVSIATPPT